LEKKVFKGVSLVILAQRLNSNINSFQKMLYFIVLNEQKKNLFNTATEKVFLDL